MNFTKALIAIAIMAIVTYFTRVLPILIFKKPIQSTFIRSFLMYVPYAVLGAMTFPDILYSTTYQISAIFGLACALILSFFNKSLLTVAISAVAVVYVVERILEYINIS